MQLPIHPKLQPSLGRLLIRGAAVLGLVTAMTTAASAQAPEPVTGLDLGGFPAVNFDADEGFGYGVVAGIYQYGDGSRLPYVWGLQPTVFFTTGGRREISAFFDAPALVGRWRVSAFVGDEKRIGTPWYGLGNESPRDPALEEGENPWYYAYGRSLGSALLTLQRPLGSSSFWVLLGAGAVHTGITPVPENEGTTLLSEQIAAGRPLVEGWLNHLRVGLVRDTRDRETGPRRGSWSEILLQRVDEGLGSAASFTRWTVTDRRYLSRGPVTFANRVLLQGVEGDVPLADLHRVQTSTRDQEGLGGSKTVRGMLRNRFAGRGLFLWNAEVRWRAADLRVVGQSIYLVFSGFVDTGRVWVEGPRIGELLTDLHHGWGGGMRVGMGPDFLAAVDAGTGAETGVQLYIGLGYLF